MMDQCAAVLLHICGDASVEEMNYARLVMNFIMDSIKIWNFLCILCVHHSIIILNAENDIK